MGYIRISRARAINKLHRHDGPWKKPQPSGDLDVLADLTLTGSGELATTIDGIDSIALEIPSTAGAVTLRLEGLTLCRGFAPTGCAVLLDAGWITPIVFVNSGTSQEEIEYCSRHGDDYLTKPFTPESLNAVIAQWLQRGEPSATEES